MTIGIHSHLMSVAFLEHRAGAEPTMLMCSTLERRAYSTAWSPRCTEFGGGRGEAYPGGIGCAARARRTDARLCEGLFRYPGPGLDHGHDVGWRSPDRGDRTVTGG